MYVTHFASNALRIKAMKTVVQVLLCATTSGKANETHQIKRFAKDLQNPNQNPPKPESSASRHTGCDPDYQ